MVRGMQRVKQKKKKEDLQETPATYVREVKIKNKNSDNKIMKEQ